VVDARGLSSERMLDMAREFNYSESTFVLPPERGGAARVRIFTPGGEVPFAGHPTIGTAHVLFAAGVLRADGDESTVVLEENVGDVAVRVRHGGGAAPLGAPEPAWVQLSVAQLPTETPAPGVEAMARVLSLAPDDFVGGDWAPRVGSCGLPFVLAAVRSPDAVARARIHMDAWDRETPGYESRHVMVFAMDGASADVRARVFVPELSVPEDPATGSACAALAGYLARRTPRLDGTLRWTVDQGIEMGRPSRLELEADKSGGVVTAVRVGGRSVVVSEGTMWVRGDGGG
jgi:trans-2,3-dihydro-3-hydroxyanthranilate isomerase